MRICKWLSLLMALCLLCAAIPAGLAEDELAVQAAEDAGADLSPGDAEAALCEGLPGPAPTDAIPNAGGSEVPLRDYNFPDASFRAYLEAHCDTNGNGYLSDGEINAVDSLDLRGLNIADLKGIGFFPSLTELNCSDNWLSSLDLRGNPWLLKLDCGNNRLESLDVSGCIRLQTLDCSRNQLGQLRFGESGGLFRLACNDNALLTLDLGVFNPDALSTVMADVSRTVTPGRAGSGGVSTIGTKDFSLTCDDYIQLTMGSQVLRSLTAKRVRLEPTDITLEMRKTHMLEPVFEPAEAKVPLYFIMVGEAGVFSLTNDRLITALKPGRARLDIYTDMRFSKASLVGMINVTVVRPQPYAVEFVYDKVDLGLGETLYLEARVEPGDATTALTFQSEDPKVVAITGTEDNKIQIKGKKIGVARITVTTSNGKTDTSTVTVKPAPQKISLDKKGTVKLGLDNSLFLRVTVEPKGCGTNLTWTSSDESVATVRRGTVTAKKKGTATITVKTFNGHKASVKFKVIDPVPETITLNKKNCKMNAGDTFKLKATIKPDNAKDKKVTWSSSNKKVASVDKNGVVVAKKKGTATITAKASNGIKATCKVTVVIPQPTGVQIVHTKTEVKVKKTLKLKAALSPAHAESKLTWSSSDAKIATVNKKGEVKGKKKGKVTITVRTANGLKDSIDITVK